MLKPIESIYSGSISEFTRQHANKTNKFDRGYVYILRLSNGFTKVGCSADPYERFAGLKRGLRSTGISLCDVWISCSHINYKDNEKQILTMLEGKEKDGEFFKIPFDDAFAFVMGMAVKTEYSLEELKAKEESSTALINSLNQVHEFARSKKR